MSTAVARPPQAVEPIGRMTVVELRLFLREPAALISSLAFPLFLALVLGAAFGDWTATGRYRIVDVQVPGLMAVVAANLALMGIPIALTDYKERGILKRYQASPVRLRWILVVMHLVGTVVLLAGSLILVLTTLTVFGLRFGGDPLTVVVVLLLGAVALNAVGFALGGLLPTTRQAQAVGFCVFFPMLFLSGAVWPIDRFPAALEAVSYAIPLRYLVDPLVGVWIGEPVSDQWPSLLVLVGVAAVALGVVRATFRWR
jgi:ABC-2 type transport system permease protein